MPLQHILSSQASREWVTHHNTTGETKVYAYRSIFFTPRSRSIARQLFTVSTKIERPGGRPVLDITKQYHPPFVSDAYMLSHGYHYSPRHLAFWKDG